MRGWFTESEGATIICHCPPPLLTCELHRPIRLLSNCNVSDQCNDGLNGDSGGLLDMVTSVTQVEITQFL